MGHRVI